MANQVEFRIEKNPCHPERSAAKSKDLRFVEYAIQEEVSDAL